jgi:hypothetical protein
MVHSMTKLLVPLVAVLLLVLGFGTRPAEAAITPCQDGTTQLPGPLNDTPYENPTPIEDRSFDGYNSAFTPNSASNDHAIELGKNVLRNRLCVGGAIIKNIHDPNYQLTWRQWHDDVGGHGTQVFAKSINVGDIYIHGGEDGIKLQNCAEGNPPAGSNGCDVQQPGGSFVVTDVAVRNHHDDAFDNDDCMPGTIDNVLVEGHTFISTQEESSSSGPCQSAGEGNINVKNSVIRTMPVNAYDGGVEDKFHGGGKWFKWDEKEGTVNDHHTVNLTNVALVVDQTPRSGWDSTCPVSTRTTRVRRHGRGRTSSCT